ncbi:glycosyltransferase family 39 protein [Candidatus Uhrbacteria bacterium]|nr:glycosyltransferase family 39 protein [Candidatus Uhrbacteria bacterium]
MNTHWLRGPWIAMFAGFVLAASFVVLQPGHIAKDAGEYDALAQSIVQGRYEIDGQASMLREPGYPTLRASIRVISDSPSVVLWFQVLLFVAIIWLVWDSFRRLESRLALIGAWSAALSYGLAVYASRHLLEMFAAFLVALVVWFAVRAMHAEKIWKDLILFSIASAALILTRVPLALVPISLAIMLAWYWKSKGLFEVAKRGSVFVAILIALLSPWVIRNGTTFGVWSITGRTGIQVAARAYKANESWGRLRDSLGSVVVGRSLNALKYPQSKPIILEQWKWVWDRFAAWKLDRSEIDADKALRKEAFGILLSDVPHFLRGGLWSIVDMGRLLALPSPLAPEFGIEGMFWPKVEAKNIGMMDRWILVLAHLVQAAWWLGMLIGLFFGFKRFGRRFFPGYIVLAVVIAHIPADNIVRYAAPIQPWLIFLVMSGWWYMILPWLTRGKFGLKLPANRYGTSE